ncbi:NAD(P)H-binding protein [Cohnella hashimotonis]|uniref:NAD(P)H-binding protein n=1 Tax=Cohnella hashimotonis TaxID=2826895 RepID=A0ABT6TSE3_9BACL|nr:NAD(P)H-binding protein [Cohnella hashimotonis]MDI4649774.1 NAD(P)H-binding protein [Cohnella hashimotonis]
MQAIVIGATGATGADLLDLLLEDNAFRQVVIFVRRSPGIQHEKLKVHVIDFDNPGQWGELVQGDVLFSCLGTTLKTAGSQEAQWKIDYEYQYSFAKAASENGVPACVLVSADFASPASRNFYSRMKGRLEEAVKALGFARLTILNPPLLVRKKSDRSLEVVASKVLQFFNRMGILRSQKPLRTEILAQAMVKAAKSNKGGLTKIRGKAIWEMAEARQ